MWQDLLAALCLVMVIEGMAPFISPEGWKQAMAEAAKLDNRTLRIIGGVAMLTGLVFLNLIR